VIGAEPVRLIDKGAADKDNPAFASPNSFAAFCIGLAATVYLMTPDSTADECFMSAVDVVLAAYTKFHSAYLSAESAARLAQLYADMANILP